MPTLIGRIVQRLAPGWFVRRPGPPPPEGAPPGAFGEWGEAWAAYHYFHARGAAIIARRWIGSGHELDLVVREGGQLVFVEVKYRPPGEVDPLAQVRDPKRQRHWRSAARAYLWSLNGPPPPVRFDALLVTPNPERPEEPWIDCLEAIIGAERDR